MPTSVRPVRVNHMNLVVEDFDASVAHFEALYGAHFLADLPSKEWHACLIEVGRVMFELFIPYDFLLNARFGPHYLGVEYQADMAEAREAVASHGVRIARDIGVALHTHPADTLGVAFEFYEGFFDGPPANGGMKSAVYWRDEHPLGLLGLKRYAIAVDDLEAGSRFLQSFLSAEPLYDAARPAANAHAIGLRVADSVVEVIAPVADGPLERRLQREGPGVCSTVFGVRDLEQARRRLSGLGVELAPGGAPEGFAVPGRANRGAVFEFEELTAP